MHRLRGDLINVFEWPHWDEGLVRRCDLHTIFQTLRTRYSIITSGGSNQLPRAVIQHHQAIGISHRDIEVMQHS